MWGYSLSNLLLALALIGGSVSAIAGYFSAFISNQETAEFQKEIAKTKREADILIAEANTQAANAYAEAAIANQQTKLLEDKIAQANLKTAEIQKLVQWRTISNNEVIKISNNLRDFKEPIQINAQISDPETMVFAYSIHLVLQDLGYKASLGSTGRPFFFGVQVVGPQGDGLERLQSAFSDIGIKADTAYGTSYVINVGSRLPDIVVPKFQIIP